MRQSRLTGQITLRRVDNRDTVHVWFNSMQHPTNMPAPGFTCDVPINSGPQTFVLRAALYALNAWVVDGTPPPRSARLKMTSVNPPVFAVDKNGIALGGIRTPAVNAPIATLSGVGQTGGTQFCNIFGTTVPVLSRITASTPLLVRPTDSTRPTSTPR